MFIISPVRPFPLSLFSVGRGGGLSLFKSRKKRKREGEKEVACCDESYRLTDLILRPTTLTLLCFSPLSSSSWSWISSLLTTTTAQLQTGKEGEEKDHRRERWRGQQEIPYSCCAVLSCAELSCSGLWSGLLSSPEFPTLASKIIDLPM